MSVGGRVGGWVSVAKREHVQRRKNGSVCMLRCEIAKQTLRLTNRNINKYAEGQNYRETEMHTVRNTDRQKTEKNRHTDRNKDNDKQI